MKKLAVCLLLAAPLAISPELLDRLDSTSRLPKQTILNLWVGSE